MADMAKIEAEAERQELSIKVQEEADKLRLEAKGILSQLLNISDIATDQKAQRLIECIVSTAVLDTMLVIREGFGVKE